MKKGKKTGTHTQTTKKKHQQKFNSEGSSHQLPNSKSQACPLSDNPPLPHVFSFARSPLHTFLNKTLLSVFNLFLTNSARQMPNLHLATLWKATFFFGLKTMVSFLIVKQWRTLNYNEVIMHAQFKKVMFISFVTPWSVAHQSPLPMAFLGKNTWRAATFLLQQWWITLF